MRMSTSEKRSWPYNSLTKRHIMLTSHERNGARNRAGTKQHGATCDDAGEGQGTWRPRMAMGSMSLARRVGGCTMVRRIYEGDRQRRMLDDGTDLDQRQRPSIDLDDALALLAVAHSHLQAY